MWEIDVDKENDENAALIEVLKIVSQWPARTEHVEESIHKAYCSFIEKVEHFINIEVVKSYNGSHLAKDVGLHQSALYIVFLPSRKGDFRECDFSRTKYPLFVEILDDGLHQSAIFSFLFDLALERSFKTNDLWLLEVPSVLATTRIHKIYYNQLLRIEEELGAEAVYVGANFRKPVEPY
uniref:Enolase C-terminal TIM barrel domain-containing protein n=1 Tax=Tanacetum cinerariifolium TaxID=118510 RepID=A0A6L2P2W9_TANCI|nr:hypothetical protein [Tanacetum cinerariifolium]